jgi:DNA-binding transcriptional ArsR family regulator
LIDFRRSDRPVALTVCAKRLTIHAISKHLSVLENAGLIASEQRGQYIHHSLVRDIRGEPGDPE